MTVSDETVNRWFSQAAQQLHNGNHQLAIERLKRVLGAEPEHAAAHALLSQALLQAKRIHAALYEARLAVGFAPESSDAHHALGRSLIVHQKLDAARTELRIAQSLDPEDVRVELALGLVAELSGDRGAELQHLERALSLAPDSVLVLARLADSWRRRGEFDKAEMYARTALEQEPESGDALVVMGFVLLKRGRVAEAREHALWALSRDATDVGALSLLVAVKSRESLLMGLWWRLNSWLTQAGNRRALTVLLSAFVVQRLISTYCRQHGFALAESVVSFGWVAICAYTWIGPSWFLRKIREETGSVVLSKDY